MKLRIPFFFRKGKILMLLAVTGSIFLTGCGRTSGRSELITLPALAESEEADSAGTGSGGGVENVDVYLDVTPSMVGYLGLKYNTQENIWITQDILDQYGSVVPRTAYMEALEIMNDTLIQAWPGADRQYFRFDVGIARMMDMRSFVETAVQSSSYTKTYYDEALPAQTVVMQKWFGSNSEEHYDYTENYLSDTISALNPEHVSIVITDLYELADDTNALYDAISDRIVKDDNVLSLIGIQSQFAGKIYDLDAQKSSITYGINDFLNNPSEEGVRYHPFYLLIFGEEEAVAGLTEELMDGFQVLFDGSEAKTRVKNQLFVCEKQVTGIDDYSFQEAFPISRNGFQYDTSVRFLAEEGRILPQDFYAYKISRGTFEEGTILTHTFRVENDALKDLLAEACEDPGQIQRVWEAALQNTQTDEFENAPVPDDIFQVDDIQWDGEGTLQVSVHFNQVSRLTRGLYRFRVFLTYPVEEQKMESWVNEWNLDKSRINEWLADPDTFPGEQTSNLANIVGILLEKTNPKYENHEIAYLDFYFNIV